MLYNETIKTHTYDSSIITSKEFYAMLSNTIPVMLNLSYDLKPEEDEKEQVLKIFDNIDKMKEFDAITVEFGIHSKNQDTFIGHKSKIGNKTELEKTKGYYIEEHDIEQSSDYEKLMSYLRQLIPGTKLLSKNSVDVKVIEGSKTPEPTRMSK